MGHLFPWSGPRRAVTLGDPDPHSTSRPVTVASPTESLAGMRPEIDLSCQPIDPGISGLHAVLVAQPDDSHRRMDLHQIVAKTERLSSLTRAYGRAAVIFAHC